MDDDLGKWRVSISDLNMSMEIGEGGFGVVWKATMKGREVAVKKIGRSTLQPEKRELFYREVACMSKLHDPFIVPFRGFVDSESCRIVTDYVPNGSLYDILHPKKPSPPLELSPTDKTVIAFGVAMGMCHIHSEGYIHRDLKPQNILISAEKLPLICDFGTSRLCDRTEMTGQIGTANYMSPEIIASKAYDKAVDVYSFGVTLWEMLVGEIPFKGMDGNQIMALIVHEGNTLMLPDDAPDGLTSLIERCCQRDPKNRPSFKMILAEMLDGDVFFPKCDKGEYFAKIRPFSADSLLTPDETESSGQFSRTDTYLGQQNVMELAAAYLNVLNHTVPEKRKLESIEFFRDHVDAVAEGGFEIWPPLLTLVKDESDLRIHSLVMDVAVKLAQRASMLARLLKVPNLVACLRPESFELFLYIVRFSPDAIEAGIVLKLFEMFEKKNAINLLCLIALKVQSSEEQRDTILSFFAANILRMDNLPDGHLALRVLSTYGKLETEVIRKFYYSSINANLVAAYECMFSLEKTPTGPPLVTPEQAVVHVVSTDEDLRACALEFLRRHTPTLIDRWLTKVIRALRVCALEYASNDAVLLLCRIFRDQQRTMESLEATVIDTLCNIPPEKAPRVLRLFLVIANFPRDTVRFLVREDMTKFMAASMKYGDDQCFLCICFVIDKVCKRMGDDFPRFLDRFGGIETIMSRLPSLVTRTQDVSRVCGVLNKLGKLGYYSPHYATLIPILFDAIDRSLPTLPHLLETANKMTSHNDFVRRLLNEGASRILVDARSKLDPESREWRENEDLINWLNNSFLPPA